ncbi:hypothetical protein [Actinosynnema sp. ALI-1.44]|uniref:hypothetical protein n=1 Tax=Actinosynnema sp. ALI-1.44 TaxID=1933779 RepID=UPI00143DD46B|nr:hypothetical protein [Actinosynnema sp. ALI-1.44]
MNTACWLSRTCLISRYRVGSTYESLMRASTSLDTVPLRIRTPNWLDVVDR